MKIKGRGEGYYEIMDTALADGVNFLLAPATAPNILYLYTMKDFGFDLRPTICVGYLEADVIAAREYPGTIPMFAYLSCFSKDVWLLIIASIAILSMISSIDKKTFEIRSNIFKIFYNFMFLLISKEMQKSIIDGILSPILCVWLLSAMFLSNQFTAYFMDFMVTAVPMDRIDSLEDLVKHKDMKIVILESHSFMSYVNENDTELKRSLSSMLDPYSHDMEPSYKKLAKGFKDLSYGYLANRELMIFILIDIRLNYIKEPPDIFDILHLSERTSVYTPYFMVLNNDSPDWLKVNLNKMCVI